MTKSNAKRNVLTGVAVLVGVTAVVLGAPRAQEEEREAGGIGRICIGDLWVDLTGAEAGEEETSLEPGAPCRSTRLPVGPLGEFVAGARTAAGDAVLWLYEKEDEDALVSSMRSLALAGWSETGGSALARDEVPDLGGAVMERPGGLLHVFETGTNEDGGARLLVVARATKRRER